MTYRTALAGGFMVLATLTADACQPLNEALNDRDLECTGVPDDICATLADDTARQWAPANIAEHGPVVKVVVEQVDCVDWFDRRDPAAVRCFHADSSTVDPADGSDLGAFSETYYQYRDGRLFNYHHRLIGTFAAE